ncbi:hypothetical protein CAC42_3251 [Sphaceloma murrayae]|uniref:ER membrane protein complex subunit 10 n=1 Tax=Sphaceloma murrayae TaxID=2082308 RepID=A0A2K1QFE3_9PEZI|nr:hypothetical protein CAC42_3251 [Sphaceloma murrayae]
MLCRCRPANPRAMIIEASYPSSIPSPPPYHSTAFDNMLLPRIPAFLPLFLLLIPLSLAATLSPQTISILLQPSTDTVPYLDIHYDPSSLSAAILKTHSLPSLPPAPLLPLGFNRPDLTTDAFTSILLPPSALSSSRDRTLQLLVDRHGRPYNVNFISAPALPPNDLSSASPSSSSSSKPKSTSTEPIEGTLSVEVVQQKPGPVPALNRPVVLRADGKVEGAEPEKTFLQKYWWAIGIFLVIQLVSGGGGDK